MGESKKSIKLLCETISATLFAYYAIDYIYDKKIDSETNDATLLKKRELDENNVQSISSYTTELENKLDIDIGKMKDIEIKTKYQQKLDGIIKNLKKELDTQLGLLNKNLNKEKEKVKRTVIESQIKDLKEVWKEI